MNDDITEGMHPVKPPSEIKTCPETFLFGFLFSFFSTTLFTFGRVYTLMILILIIIIIKVALCVCLESSVLAWGNFSILCERLLELL